MRFAYSNAPHNYVSSPDNMVMYTRSTAPGTTDGSTGPTATAWYKLRLVCGTNTVSAYVGAAGSDFSLIGTVNATLPSTNVLPEIFMIKSAGTTDTYTLIDYMKYKIIYNTVR